MTIHIYKKTGLIGGGADDLDAMDGLTGGKGGAALLDGDLAFVHVSGVEYKYILDDDLDEAESSPDYIRPDTNAGTKNWVLQKSGTRIDDLIAAQDNTDLNVSTSAHGLCPKGTDTGTKYLKDDGTWDTPPGLGYNIISVDAAAMVGCTTNGAASGTNEYVTNDIEWDYFAFDGGATEERVQFKLVMPEDWDRGTILAKFIWSTATGSSANDTVEWGIKGQATSNDGAIDTAFGDVGEVISDAVIVINGTDLQITPTTPAITVGGTPALGDLITFEVYRNTDGTDDCAEDAWLFGVEIQYKKTNAVSVWS